MALQVVLVLVSLACVSSHVIESGQIAYKLDTQPNDYFRYHVTDGHVLMEALVSADNILQDCHVTSDPVMLSLLLSDDLASKMDIGQTAIQHMVKSCARKHLSMSTKRQSGDDNGSAKTTALPFAPEKTGDPAGSSGSFAIFPGTKWCGLANKASSYNDLGEHRATDLCCRTHDHCPYFIDHFETKYNYHNMYPWTLSYCDCDTALYHCLQAVNTTASDEVGKLFFGLLSVKCFDFESGQFCADEHLDGLWCEKEAYGEKAVPKDFPYQWGKGSNDSDDAKAGPVG